MLQFKWDGLPAAPKRNGPNQRRDRIAGERGTSATNQGDKLNISHDFRVVKKQLTTEWLNNRYIRTGFSPALRLFNLLPEMQISLAGKAGKPIREGKRRHALYRLPTRMYGSIPKTGLPRSGTIATYAVCGGRRPELDSSPCRCARQE